MELQEVICKSSDSALEYIGGYVCYKVSSCLYSAAIMVKISILNID